MEFRRVSFRSPNVAPFRPETLDDWEAGLKSELFDRRLTFNVNGFLYKYRNMQVIFFPTGGVAGARPVIANAAKSTLYGIDVDFTARPSSQLTVNRSEEHTSELQSLMRISYAVFCLKKKNHVKKRKTNKYK